jgi:hypothetical protein
MFSSQSAHRLRRGCQAYAPATLYTPGSFLVLISVRGCQPQGHSVPGSVCLPIYLSIYLSSQSLVQSVPESVSHPTVAESPAFMFNECSSLHEWNSAN